ncbi:MULTISPECIES: ABC transporter permease [Methanobacterium]|jgi:ABC-2 type transport system permease protein|uniref:Daunorubicin ABC transporter permease n=1 Tax=Methanobacterium bryantii TaxID=2161 RepID=A0A2A2H0R9_METBR|nr:MULTISPECIES: ABC transporter permease [Methanobacterium]OEC88604.1 daunorubicin ABC transporter permease [Methanobacterium sp. A39]PAV02998.1 daunorubicin ABC transporter permease [Methanobacterium bryantii]
MSELEGIYTIWLRETKRYVRYRSRILTSVVTPLLWLLIFGTGLGSAIRFGGILGGYQAFIYPGIIGQTILFTTIFSGLSVIMDRQYGFLKEIMVAPISRPSIVLGKSMGIGTAALIQGVILLLLSFVVGVQMTVFAFISSVVLIILISLGFAGLGLLIATLTDSMEGFNLIMSFIVLPIFLLSGALFPVTGLPTWLQFAVYLDPLTYGVDALRSVILNQSALPLEISILVISAFALLMIFVSAYMFTKKEQGLM